MLSQDYLPPPLPDIPDEVEVKQDADVIPPMPIPPPLPDFIPPINLPKVIPLSTPEKATTKSPNEYLPPIDVRSGFLPTWEEWKVKNSIYF